MSFVWLLVYSFGSFGAEKVGYFLVAWLAVRVGDGIGALDLGVMKQALFLDH